MRTLTLLLLFALAPMFAHGATITVTCTAPTAFTDSTPIPAGTVITYKLYSSPAQNLLDTRTSCSFPRTGVGPGTYAHYVTASIAGVESDPTNIVTDTIGAPPPPKPNAPSGAKSTVTVSGPTAYSVIKSDQTLVLLPVGTVPLGSVCDTTQGVVRSGNMFNVIDRSLVTYSGTARPLVVLAQCS